MGTRLSSLQPGRRLGGSAKPTSGIEKITTESYYSNIVNGINPIQAGLAGSTKGAQRCLAQQAGISPARQRDGAAAGWCRVYSGTVRHVWRGRPGPEQVAHRLPPLPLAARQAGETHQGQGQHLHQLHQLLISIDLYT